ncbi:MAG: MBL fold metallo-hydrolase [Myxococcaceae bacterium]
MKLLHRKDLYGWSRFNEERDVDFNSVLWTRPDGNIAFDPLPLSEHDAAQIQKLGGVAWIVITNTDHVRDAAEIARKFGTKIAAPLGERNEIRVPCDRWLSGGDELVPGLRAIGFDGGKTACELAFVLEETTLITGDLIRAHRAGTLRLLPDEKLKDPARAKQSLKRLLDFPKIDTVLVGDGWSYFGDALAALRKLTS